MADNEMPRDGGASCGEAREVEAGVRNKITLRYTLGSSGYGLGVALVGQAEDSISLKRRRCSIVK